MRPTLFAIAVLILPAHAAFATPMLPSEIQATFFMGQPFTASTQGGTKFKMNFMPDGTMTREPRGTSGGKSSGTWKLIPRASARLGSSARSTATPLFKAARISGRFKRVRPQLQPGPNSIWTEFLL
jgi:hypothetical protein